MNPSLDPIAPTPTGASENALLPFPDSSRVERVLMSADTVGGVWTYAVELAAALARRDVEVVLAAMGGPLGDIQEAEARAIPGLELHHHPWRLEWMEDPWTDVEASGEWLLDLARRHRPDVVHVNGYAHAHLPWGAPVVVVAHSCVCSWHEQVRGEAPPPEAERYRREVARGLAAADLRVAPTRTMADWLDRFYGSFDPVRVIPNARNPELFPPVLAAEDRDPVIFAAGRLWDEAKNVSTLAGIAPRLSWPVEVAGTAERPGGGRVELPGVRFLGRLDREQMAARLGRAAIYALPVRYEPFGVGFLEAALGGCALVVGDVPTLREVWEEAAVYVPPADGEALAAALEELARDSERRSRLADAARRRALDHAPDRMADAYLDAYREAAMPHRSPLPRAPEVDAEGAPFEAPMGIAAE